MTMKTEKYEVTKEQILEAHADACNEWKEKLEEWFPKVFEQKCEVGKWYWANEKARRDKTFLFFNNGKNKTYGFDWDGNWGTYLNHGRREITGVEATNRELTECLANHVVKNYKVGMTVSDMHRNNNMLINDLISFTYVEERNEFWSKSEFGNVCLFKDGVWSEIINQSNSVEVSKSDIAKLMNVEVYNLKIVD